MAESGIPTMDHGSCDVCSMGQSCETALKLNKFVLVQIKLCITLDTPLAWISGSPPWNGSMDSISEVALVLYPVKLIPTIPECHICIYINFSVCERHFYMRWITALEWSILGMDGGGLSFKSCGGGQGMAAMPSGVSVISKTVFFCNLHFHTFKFAAKILMTNAAYDKKSKYLCAESQPL